MSKDYEDLRKKFDAEMRDRAENPLKHMVSRDPVDIIRDLIDMGEPDVLARIAEVLGIRELESRAAPSVGAQGEGLTNDDLRAIVDAAMSDGRNYSKQCLADVVAQRVRDTMTARPVVQWDDGQKNALEWAIDAAVGAKFEKAEHILRALLAQPAAQAMQECRCTMTQKLVGDGGAVCNPDHEDAQQPQSAPQPAPASGDARDAARYRFIRDTTKAVRDDSGGGRVEVTPEQFDAMTDAAMEQASAAPAHGEDADSA